MTPAPTIGHNTAKRRLAQDELVLWLALRQARTDYPHLSLELFDLEWAPDPALRARILVDNPATLFGV